MKKYIKMIRDLANETDIDRRVKLRYLYIFGNDLTKRVGKDILSSSQVKEVRKVLSLIRREINILEVLR